MNVRNQTWTEVASMAIPARRPHMATVELASGNKVVKRLSHTRLKNYSKSFQYVIALSKGRRVQIYNAARNKWAVAKDYPKGRSSVVAVLSVGTRCVIGQSQSSEIDDGSLRRMFAVEKSTPPKLVEYHPRKDTWGMRNAYPAY